MHKVTLQLLQMHPYMSKKNEQFQNDSLMPDQTGCLYAEPVRLFCSYLLAIVLRLFVPRHLV